MPEQQKTMVNYLGTCPVCGKGKIAEGPNVYRCNYAASMEDKCDFHIFKSYNGANITAEHVKQLIEEGKTKTIEFVSKAGNKFYGYLTIEDGIVKMQYANNSDNLEKLDAPCPICGEPVYVYQHGYGCKNIHETDEDGNKKCTLWINKVIASRTVTKNEVEQLLLTGKTSFLDGFVNNTGKEFSSRLVLDQEGNINFDSTVCKCPVCGGDIKIGNKSYNCSNWKSKGCKFTVWREISYRNITPEEVIQLCENRATEELHGFRNKDKTKTFSAQLILSDDCQVKML